MPKSMANLESLSDILNNPDAPRKEYYTTPEFAKLIGFHEHTLRYWDKIGKFRPHHKTPGGTRMYALSQIAELQDIYAADGLYNDPEARKLKHGQSDVQDTQDGPDAQDTADASGLTED